MESLKGGKKALSSLSHRFQSPTELFLRNGNSATGRLAELPEPPQAGERSEARLAGPQAAPPRGRQVSSCPHGMRGDEPDAVRTARPQQTASQPRSWARG